MLLISNSPDFDQALVGDSNPSVLTLFNPGIGDLMSQFGELSGPITFDGTNEIVFKYEYVAEDTLLLTISLGDYSEELAPVTIAPGSWIYLVQLNTYYAAALTSFFNVAGSTPITYDWTYFNVVAEGDTLNYSGGMIEIDVSGVGLTTFPAWGAMRQQPYALRDKITLSVGLGYQSQYNILFATQPVASPEEFIERFYSLGMESAGLQLMDSNLILIIDGEQTNLTNIQDPNAVLEVTRIADGFTVKLGDYEHVINLSGTYYPTVLGFMSEETKTLTLTSGKGTFTPPELGPAQNGPQELPVEETWNPIHLETIHVGEYLTLDPSAAIHSYAILAGYGFSSRSSVKYVITGDGDIEFTLPGYPTELAEQERSFYTAQCIGLFTVPENTGGSGGYSGWTTEELAELPTLDAMLGGGFNDEIFRNNTLVSLGVFTRAHQWNGSVIIDPGRIGNVLGLRQPQGGTGLNETRVKIYKRQDQVRMRVFYDNGGWEDCEGTVGSSHVLMLEIFNGFVDGVFGGDPIEFPMTMVMNATPNGNDFIQNQSEQLGLGQYRLNNMGIVDEVIQVKPHQRRYGLHWPEGLDFIISAQIEPQWNNERFIIKPIIEEFGAAYVGLVAPPNQSTGIFDPLTMINSWTLEPRRNALAMSAWTKREDGEYATAIKYDPYRDSYKFSTPALVDTQSWYPSPGDNSDVEYVFECLDGAILHYAKYADDPVGINPQFDEKVDALYYPSYMLPYVNIAMRSRVDNSQILENSNAISLKPTFPRFEVTVEPIMGFTSIPGFTESSIGIQSGLEVVDYDCNGWVLKEYGRLIPDQNSPTVGQFSINLRTWNNGYFLIKYRSDLEITISTYHPSWWLGQALQIKSTLVDNVHSFTGLLFDQGSGTWGDARLLDLAIGADENEYITLAVCSTPIQNGPDGFMNLDFVNIQNDGIPIMIREADFDPFTMTQLVPVPIGGNFMVNVELRHPNNAVLSGDLAEYILQDTRIRSHHLGPMTMTRYDDAALPAWLSTYNMAFSQILSQDENAGIITTVIEETIQPTLYGNWYYDHNGDWSYGQIGFSSALIGPEIANNELHIRQISFSSQYDVEFIIGDNIIYPTDHSYFGLDIREKLIGATHVYAIRNPDTHAIERLIMDKYNYTGTLERRFDTGILDPELADEEYMVEIAYWGNSQTLTIDLRLQSGSGIQSSDAYYSNYGIQFPAVTRLYRKIPNIHPGDMDDPFSVTSTIISNMNH